MVLPALVLPWLADDFLSGGAGGEEVRAQSGVLGVAARPDDPARSEPLTVRPAAAALGAASDPAAGIPGYPCYRTVE